MSVWTEFREALKRAVNPFDISEEKFNPLKDGLTLQMIGISHPMEMLVGKMIDDARPDQGDRDSTVKTAVGVRRAIYGVAKTGGVIVHAEDTGGDNNNKFRHLVIAFAGHRVAEFTTVWVDDVESDDPKFADNLWVTPYLGDPDQVAAPTLLAESAVWTAAHRLRGIAYLHVKYKKKDFPSGISDIKALVKGKDDIDDPRDGSTGWTDNLALCIRDYSLWSETMGAAADELDDSLGTVQADLCDELVICNRTGTETEKRYTCNGVMDLVGTPLNGLKTMTQAGAGRACYTQGAWRIHLGAYAAPAQSLSERDLDGGLSFSAGPGKAARINTVRGTYFAPALSYARTDYPLVTSATYLAEDAEELDADLHLGLTNSPTMAMRVAKIMMERSRRAAPVTMPAKFTTYPLQPEDRVELSIDRLGWAAKTLAVRQWRFDPMGALQLELLPDDAAIYTWLASDVSEVSPPPPTNLPSPWEIPAVTGLVAAVSFPTVGSVTVAPRVTLIWDDAEMPAYRVRYRLDADSEWTVLPDFSEPSAIIDGLAPGDYVFAVAGVNSLPLVGAFTETPLTTVAAWDATASPPAVTALDTVESGGSFAGRDCTVVWELDESVWPAAMVDAYRVEILTDAGTLLRTLPPTREKAAVYTFGANLDDGAGAPAASFKVRVSVLGRNGQTSEAAELACANTVPSPMSGLSVTGELLSVRLALAYPVPADFDRVEIYASQTNARATAGPFAEAQIDEVVRDGLGHAESWYFWGRVKDAFGQVSSWYPDTVAGVAGQTSTDSAAVRELIEGKILASSLHASLRERIDLMDETFVQQALETLLALDDSGRQAAAQNYVERVSRATDLEAEAVARETLSAKVLGDDGEARSAGLIFEEKQARATAIETEAATRELLAALLLGDDGTAETAGLIFEEKIARAAADSAEASARQVLQTEVEDNVATVSEQAASIDGLRTQWAIKSILNGIPGGIGLAGSNVDGEVFHEFTALVNRFSIINPEGAALTITGLTRTGSVATLFTAAEHGLAVGGHFIVAGVDQPEFCGTFAVKTVETDWEITFDLVDVPTETAATGQNKTLYGAIVPFVLDGDTVYMNTAVIGEGRITRALIEAVLQSATVAGDGQPVWSIDDVNGIIARKLTIKDDDGTVVLESGGRLDSSRVEGQQVFAETFAAGVGQWEATNGAAEASVLSDSSAVAGGKLLRIGDNSGNDTLWLAHKGLIPFEPAALYRLKVRARRPAGAGTFHAGWLGIAADGVTMVSAPGSAVYYSAHFHAAQAAAPSSPWGDFVGYTKGHGATVGTSVVGTLADPGQMHPDVRYLRPYIVANVGDVAGITEIDSVAIDIVPPTFEGQGDLATKDTIDSANYLGHAVVETLTVLDGSIAVNKSGQMPLYNGDGNVTSDRWYNGAATSQGIATVTLTGLNPATDYMIMVVCDVDGVFDGGSETFLELYSPSFSTYPNRVVSGTVVPAITTLLKGHTTGGSAGGSKQNLTLSLRGWARGIDTNASGYRGILNVKYLVWGSSR